MLKLGKDPLQSRFYFLSFINSLKTVLSQFSDTYMFLMDYPSIRGEDLPDYSKKDTWNLLHTYIDAYSQRLIDGCTVDVVQAISTFQPQCANITSTDQSRYDRMFQQVVQKGGESKINYTTRFQNAKALKISMVNSYTEDHIIHTLLEIFQ